MKSHDAQDSCHHYIPNFYLAIYIQCSIHVQLFVHHTAQSAITGHFLTPPSGFLYKFSIMIFNVQCMLSLLFKITGKRQINWRIARNDKERSLGSAKTLLQGHGGTTTENPCTQLSGHHHGDRLQRTGGHRHGVEVSADPTGWFVLHLTVPSQSTAICIRMQ